MRLAQIDGATPLPWEARTPEGALLRTVFHDVYNSLDRIIYEPSLRRQLFVHLTTLELAMAVASDGPDGPG